MYLYIILASLKLSRCACVCVCVCVRVRVCGALTGGLHMELASGKCAPSVAKMDSGCSQESWRDGGTAGRALKLSPPPARPAPPGPIQQMSDER